MVLGFDQAHDTFPALLLLRAARCGLACGATLLLLRCRCSLLLRLGRLCVCGGNLVLSWNVLGRIDVLRDGALHIVCSYNLCVFLASWPHVTARTATINCCFLRDYIIDCALADQKDRETAICFFQVAVKGRNVELGNLLAKLARLVVRLQAVLAKLSLVAFYDS